MVPPERLRRQNRKSKLKARWWRDDLDGELKRTMEKVWLLCELKCEKRKRKNERKTEAANRKART